MNSNGTIQIELTNTDLRSEDPDISPDGEFIFFESTRDAAYNANIFIMGIDGKNQNPLSKYSGDDCLPLIVKE